MKRQPSEWKKLFSNEATDKEYPNNLQNKQTAQVAHRTQCQKNKQPIQKVGKRLKQTFLQRRHTDG